MKIHLKFFNLLLLVCFSCNLVLAEASWYDERAWDLPERAYQWYPDDIEKKQKQKEEQEREHAPKPEVAAFEALQEKVVQARKVAIMNPTQENLSTYIALQELIMQQAATFTDQWQRTIWQNPVLDYAQKGRPTNAQAMKVYDAQKASNTGEAIRQMAGQNGLLFIYRSDCPYCHAMAPILRSFQDQYGIKVMAVSLDGGPIPGFPNAVTDNGIATRLNVTTVPAMFVMDTQTKEFRPIGFGVLAINELEDRFLRLSRPVGNSF